MCYTCFTMQINYILQSPRLCSLSSLLPPWYWLLERLAGKPEIDTKVPLLYKTILNCNELLCKYCIVLYNTLLHCPVQHSTALMWLHRSVHVYSIMSCILRHSTPIVLFCYVLFSALLHYLMKYCKLLHFLHFIVLCCTFLHWFFCSAVQWNIFIDGFLTVLFSDAL